MTELALAIDCETSGLPPEGVEKGSPQYPWIVSVGAELFTLDGATRALFGSQVRGDGRSIQPGAAAVHGITSRQAGREGVSETTALGVVCGFAAQARMLVGFNVQFDRDVLESTLIRLGKNTRLLVRPGLAVIDLMKAAAPFCKIESGREDGQYRWPAFDAARAHFLGEPPRTGVHDALDDARAAARLFLRMRERGALEAA